MILLLLSVSIPYRLATNSRWMCKPIISTVVSIPYRLATNLSHGFLDQTQAISFNSLQVGYKREQVFPHYSSQRVSIPYRLATNSFVSIFVNLLEIVSIPYRLATNSVLQNVDVDTLTSFNSLQVGYKHDFFYEQHQHIFVSIPYRLATNAS